MQLELFVREKFMSTQDTTESLDKLKFFMIKKRSIKKPNQYFFNIILFLFLFLLPTQFGKFFFFTFSYISGLRIDYLAYALYASDLLVVTLIFLRIKDVLLFF